MGMRRNVVNIRVICLASSSWRAWWNLHKNIRVNICASATVKRCTVFDQNKAGNYLSASHKLHTMVKLCYIVKCRDFGAFSSRSEWYWAQHNVLNVVTEWHGTKTPLLSIQIKRGACASVAMLLVRVAFCLFLQTKKAGLFVWLRLLSFAWSNLRSFRSSTLPLCSSNGFQRTPIITPNRCAFCHSILHAIRWYAKSWLHSS